MKKYLDIKYLRYIVTLTFLFYWSVQTYKFISMNDKKETRCGVVTYKGNKDQVNKHSSDIQFIMVVEYDDTHRKEDETVTASTWSSYNVGERICFINDIRPTDKMSVMDGLLGLIGMIVFWVGLGILIVMFIVWFYSGKNPFKNDFWKED